MSLLSFVIDDLTIFYIPPSPIQYPPERQVTEADSSCGKYWGVAAMPKGIATMMQQKERCGNVLQYCGNTSIEIGIVAMRKGIVVIWAWPQCAEALQQCPITAMRCCVAAAL